jgi:hypothetical protein
MYLYTVPNIPIQLKKYIPEMIAFCVAFLTPILPAIGAMLALVFFDTITGIWKTLKNSGWEKFTSQRLSDVVSKSIMYGLLIVVSHIVETYMVGSVVPLVKMSVGVIGMIEFKSISENASEILGYDVLKQVIEKLGTTLKKAK